MSPPADTAAPLGLTVTPASWRPSDDQLVAVADFLLALARRTLAGRRATPGDAAPSQGVGVGEGSGHE
jgi:hypothetical protein